jgi:aspartate 1-decarboxylase
LVHSHLSGIQPVLDSLHFALQRDGPFFLTFLVVMLRTMLQAKLHRATVTHADLQYEGSCGIDEALLDAAGLREFQYIELYNITNGERFTTYIIKAPRGSGEVSLNGAAARKAAIGDLLIICAYSTYSEAELASYQPVIVLLDSGNGIAQIKRAHAA